LETRADHRTDGHLRIDAYLMIAFRKATPFALYDNELFGADRMLAALNREPDAPPEQIPTNVMEDIRRFVDGAEQFDDITMMCFRYAGPDGLGA
jgi:hypothetical protein